MCVGVSCLKSTRPPSFDERLYPHPWTQEKWNPQQKWVSVLLVGLFFFNNPFFAAQVLGVDCLRETFVQPSPHGVSLLPGNISFTSKMRIIEFYFCGVCVCFVAAP